MWLGDVASYLAWQIPLSDLYSTPMIGRLFRENTCIMYGLPFNEFLLLRYRVFLFHSSDIKIWYISCAKRIIYTDQVSCLHLNTVQTKNELLKQHVVLGRICDASMLCTFYFIFLPVTLSFSINVHRLKRNVLNVKKFQQSAVRLQVFS